MVMESSILKVEKDIMGNSKMENLMDMVSFNTIQRINSSASSSITTDRKVDFILIS